MKRLQHGMAGDRAGGYRDVISLAHARPPAADLFDAMHMVIGQDGVSGRLGHGLGLRLTEWSPVIPSGNTVMREGMVMTPEPGLEIAPGRVMVHEEYIKNTS